MRIKRSLPILLGVVAIAAALTLIVQLRKHAPPEPARLLPGADAFVYVNLKWVRTVNSNIQLPEVPHAAEYEEFVRETGFQFERDLDEAAFAVHYPPPVSPAATPPKSTEPPQPRFSEVFRGKIDSQRLLAYLKKISKTVDAYGSTDIYNIPLEGRTVRVAILSVDAVAVSNHDDPNVIRGIIDRSRKLASPFGGPAMLRQYYRNVPFASIGWAIARIEPGNTLLSDSPLGTVAMLFSRPGILVASARYIRALHLRAEAFTASEDDAQAIAQKIDTFLSIFHAAESSVSQSGTDPDAKAFFDSLKVEQVRDRAVLTAALPPGFIRKALTEPPASTLTPAPPPQPPAEIKPPAHPSGKQHKKTQ
jgi:hypothetical protein